MFIFLLLYITWGLTETLVLPEERDSRLPLSRCPLKPLEFVHQQSGGKECASLVWIIGVSSGSESWPWESWAKKEKTSPERNVLRCSRPWKFPFCQEANWLWVLFIIFIVSIYRWKDNASLRLSICLDSLHLILAKRLRSDSPWLFILKFFLKEFEAYWIRNSEIPRVAERLRNYLPLL